MQVGEKTWLVRLKVGEILGHRRKHKKLKGLDHFTESHIFNYAKQYITPHLITEEHENDNEKI